MKCPSCKRQLDYLHEILIGGYTRNRLSLNRGGKITDSETAAGDHDEVRYECPHCRYDEFELPEWED